MSEKRSSRYPGIRAFEVNERNLFFGREKESRKLFSLIKAKPLVVLFSKSGIGKSSLLNASIIPKLDHELYQSVRVRIQDPVVDPIDTIKAELSAYLNAETLATFSGKNEATASLWEYLRACEFSSGENRRVPILIFDQFEEFFLHQPSVRNELIEELSNLVSERMPNNIREQLRSVPFKKRSQELLNWCSPIPVKIIMAIRSDRLSLMDELTEKIPSILHNRFHLQPLKASQAEAAILEPARLTGADFLSPPFQYEQAALEQILSSLINANEEVESFQLQLVCQYIENEVIEKFSDKKDQMVTPALYGGPQGIDNILHDYYENALRRLSKEEEEKARIFIEEGLVIDGRRVGINAGIEERNFGIDDELLTKLLHSRLIRAEDTHLGRSYEISHDTLVEPIMRSFEERKRIEAEEVARQNLAAQQALLAEQRRKTFVALRWAAFGFVLFFAAAFAAYKAYGFYLVAEAQNLNIQASQLTTRSILQSETYGDISESVMLAEQAVILQDSIYKLISKGEADAKIFGEGVDVKTALLTAAYKNVGTPRNLFYKSIFPIQESEITDVTIARDSQTLAIAYRDGELRIQSIYQNDSLESRNKIHEGSINKVVFSPDGQMVLTAGKDKSARLATIDGKEIARIKRELEVTDIDFTPRGQFFVVASLDGSLQIYNLKGELNQDLQGGHLAGITGCRFFQNGEKVISWDKDNKAIIWDSLGQLVQILTLSANIRAVAISPNQKWIVTADDNKDVNLWDINGKNSRTFYGHDSKVRGVAFSPDSRSVLSYDESGKVILWNLGGEKRATISNAHTANISAVVFAPDGKTFLTTSFDNHSKIWDLSGKLIANCSGHDLGVTGGFYLPGKEKILTYGADRKILVWATNASITREMKTQKEPVKAAAFAPSGDVFLAEGEAVLSWYASNGDWIKSKKIPNSGTFNALCHHPTADWLAAGMDKDLVLLKQEGEVKKFIKQDGKVNWIAFSSTGNTIGLALEGKEYLPLFDTTGTELKKLPTGKINKLVFSSWQKNNLLDGIPRIGRYGKPLLLSIGSGDQRYLWDYETGEKLDNLESEGADLTDACFSADSKMIVGGCSDKIIRVWDLEGKVINEFNQQNTAIKSIAVSPDNKYIAAALDNGTFIILDFKGSILVKGNGISEIDPFVQFSPDGRYLLSSGSDGQRILWPFGAAEILKAVNPQNLGW